VGDGRSQTENERHPEASQAEGARGCSDNQGVVDSEIRTKAILRDCLYFTANALARTISRMAEEEFCTTGLSPSHAFLLMLVVETPGTGQKVLGESLQLAPSTVTRLVDTLVRRDLVTRKSSGRAAAVFPTQKGKELMSAIEQAWWRLHRRYSCKLGEAAGEELTRTIDQAQGQLER
jgi:DNA-binding MarR family transcriptional regulator